MFQALIEVDANTKWIDQKKGAEYTTFTDDQVDALLEIGFQWTDDLLWNTKKVAGKKLISYFCTKPAESLEELKTWISDNGFNWVVLAAQIYNTENGEQVLDVYSELDSSKITKYIKHVPGSGSVELGTFQGLPKFSFEVDTHSRFKVKRKTGGRDFLKTCKHKYFMVKD